MKKRLLLKAVPAQATGGQDRCRVLMLAAVLAAVFVLTVPGNGCADSKAAEGKLTEGFLYFRDNSGMSLRAVSKFFSRDLDAHELGMGPFECCHGRTAVQGSCSGISPGLTGDAHCSSHLTGMPTWM